MKSAIALNPFSVHSPEQIAAPDALRLFVNVFTDFHKIKDQGHTIINGPRGCGKSMIFRYLQPDCQILDMKCAIDQLPFFSILVSIKNTSLNLTELHRLIGRNANIILNEHFLTMYFASNIAKSLLALNVEETKSNTSEVNSFFKTFISRLARAGSPNLASEQKTTVREIFLNIQDICDRLYSGVLDYVRRLSFCEKNEVKYAGPLCGYIDFLLPLLQDLKSLSFMPRGPIYLLVDDADYLNTVQTMILNSWVSSRTSATVSIKVSTQLRYKTFKTVSGITIDSPHDFQEINITDIYTSPNSIYLNRVKEIVQKRLDYAGIKADPYKFFPTDEEQEKEIAKIAQRYRDEWKKTGRGHRPSDDALRYARPEFMANLKGTRKASSSYSYAGFEQLVNISSGLIRYFLEPAALMYSRERAKSEERQINFITPTIQDDIIREESSKLMISEFEKILKEDEENLGYLISKERKLQLYNLIQSLGGAFQHRLLLSNHSERRVFSVAFSNIPDPELLQLFNLGVEYGYFQRSTIGNKDGTGRTQLYILTRRLAPFFKLDPNGFAGYLWATNNALREAVNNPLKFLRQLKDRGETILDEKQLDLFELENLI